MDLSTLSIEALTGELYRRGLAVCVFQPEDVIGRVQGMTLNEATDWLNRNAKHIADRMSEQGNESIETLLAMDGHETCDDEDRQPIGWQIGNAAGENIQGEEEDPSDTPSFHILSRKVGERILHDFPGRGLQLLPIYQGDVEEPEFIEDHDEDADE